MNLDDSENPVATVPEMPKDDWSLALGWSKLVMVGLNFPFQHPLVLPVDDVGPLVGGQTAEWVYRYYSVYSHPLV